MQFLKLREYDESLVLKYPGNSFESEIAGPTSIEYPSVGHFVFVKDRKFYDRLVAAMENCDTFRKMGVVVDENFYSRNEELFTEIHEKIGFIITTHHVPLCMTKISKPFYDLKYGSIDNLQDGRETKTAKVASTAKIAPNVFLGEGVEIGENAVIHSGVSILGKTTIGANSEIFPNVTIYSNIKIGSNVRIHSGTVIGADGFGYVYDAGVHHKIWHMGGVIIEDHVEIGANTCIDCGTFSPTKIGAGSKIDNQVQVGHNGQIGMGVIMCGQSGTAGTAHIGHFCVLGGKSGVTNDVSIGDGTQVAGNAMVSNSWPKGSKLGGAPARPLNEWLRQLAFINKIMKK